MKEESAKQARRDEMFLNLMSELINNKQMQQGPSISFVSSGLEANQSDIYCRTSTINISVIATAKSTLFTFYKTFNQ